MEKHKNKTALVTLWANAVVAVLMTAMVLFLPLILNWYEEKRWLTQQGWWNAYGVLADPNPASERFHAKQGFVCEGRSPRTGSKFGRWLGTSVWCKQLRSGTASPNPVRAPLTAEELAPILQTYETLAAMPAADTQ